MDIIWLIDWMIDKRIPAPDHISSPAAWFCFRYRYQTKIRKWEVVFLRYDCYTFVAHCDTRCDKICSIWPFTLLLITRKYNDKRQHNNSHNFLCPWKTYLKDKTLRDYKRIFKWASIYRVLCLIHKINLV